MYAQSLIIIIIINDTFHFCSLLRSISFYPLYSLHSFSASRPCIWESVFQFFLVASLSKLFISLLNFRVNVRPIPHYAQHNAVVCSFQWVANWPMCNVVILSNPHNVKKMFCLHFVRSAVGVVSSVAHKQKIEGKFKIIVKETGTTLAQKFNPDWIICVTMQKVWNNCLQSSSNILNVNWIYASSFEEKIWLTEDRNIRNYTWI